MVVVVVVLWRLGKFGGRKEEGRQLGFRVTDDQVDRNKTSPFIMVCCLDPVHAGCVLDDRMFCVNLGHMRVAVCTLQDPCASSCQSLSGRIPRELHDLRVGAQAEVRQKHWDSS